VYWFHPLVWIAWRRLTLEAERSCDDAVLGRSEATAYADQLVGLAQRLSLAARMPAAKSPLLAMANRSDLAARVGAVLDSRQPRGRAGTFPVALACAAAAVLVLTMSPLRTVAAPQSAGTDAPMPQFSVSKIVVAPQSAGTDVGVAPMPRFSASTVVAAPQSASTDALMPQFSATTELVIANVTVADANGKIIEGLSANDFVVAEDGVAQAIRIFEFQKLDAPLQGTQGSVSSYYSLGYYTANQSLDGKFRRIEITCKEDATAKLDYRAGYFVSQAFLGGIGGAGQGGADSSIGPDITFPVLLFKKDAAYSEEARKAKHSGFVVLNVEVDASGQPTNIQVNRSLGLGLDEKAIEAVSQWKFKPGMKDGKPVAVQAQVVVTFRLL
jgi:TonB family protein